MNKYSVVCPDCGRVMRVKDGGIGTYVLEMADFGPYKLWVGDVRDCAPCDTQVIVGFADRPLSEHWRPDFAERVAEARATGTVIEVMPWA